MSDIEMYMIKQWAKKSIEEQEKEILKRKKEKEDDLSKKQTMP